MSQNERITASVIGLKTLNMVLKKTFTITNKLSPCKLITASKGILDTGDTFSALCYASC